VATTNPSQRSGHPDRRATLLPTTYNHAGEGCGERIESPHASCQAAVTPFLAAERLQRRAEVLIVCICGTSWREVAA
jgi:hypothetical protein